MKKLLYILCALFTLSSINAEYYEGLGFKEGKVDLTWFPIFLPYNPVIIEAGAFYGNETVRSAQLWPQGRVIAFEPNPHAFERLEQAVSNAMLKNVETHWLALNTYNGTATLHVCHGMHAKDPAFEYASSLLPLTPEMEIYCKGPRIQVPCVVLDEWCQQQNIDHIDVLRLEVEGMEFPILRTSPRTLKNTKIIYVKTFIHPYRNAMTHYGDLKKFLESSGFVLLSHWYEPGITGYAVFLSRELFDAFFKLSLGVYLGV